MKQPGSSGISNKEDLIEFDSMINLKPSLGNRTRSIADPVIREQLAQIVRELIEL
jgi:hypothetical protein